MEFSSWVNFFFGDMYEKRCVNHRIVNADDVPKWPYAMDRTCSAGVYDSLGSNRDFIERFQADPHVPTMFLAAVWATSAQWKPYCTSC